MKTVSIGVVVLLATFAIAAVRAEHRMNDAIAQRDAAIAERDSLRAAKTIVEVRPSYTFIDAIDSNLTFESWGAARQYARARQRAWQQRYCCCPCCR